jgi:molybdenum cofactor cytidylyltransferase
VVVRWVSGFKISGFSPIPFFLMNLIRALRLSPTPCLALVGAGGKSTILFQLARLLSRKGPHLSGEPVENAREGFPVVVSATTHLHIDQVSLADSHWMGSSPSEFAFLEENLHGVMLVTGPLSGDRTTGLDLVTMSWLREVCGCHDIPLLIEADGSRQHPLKAPAGHEPPLPMFVDCVIVVAGLSGLDKPLTSEFVHRPEIFSSLSGLSLGGTIKPSDLVRVLTHSSGGLKNIPPAARKVAVLNQADTSELQVQGKAIANDLIAKYDSVIVTSIPPLPVSEGEYSTHVHAVIEPVGGIILAAGEARRFGRPKQLLEFHGKPFVRCVAESALAAGLAPVVIVTGSYKEEVQLALKDLPLVFIHNEAWQSGQSSSLRLGLKALPAHTGACLFMLADQPQVKPDIIFALVDRHSQDLSPVIAPLVAGRRANPVLFDRDTYPDLLALTGDVGGRAIFSKFPPDYLDWADESLLVDIDTPSDLQKLNGLE